MDLLNRVCAVVADTIDVPVHSVNGESSSDTIDKWDSMAQVNLMMAIEQEFDLELEVEDFMALKSVASIVAYIQRVEA